MTVHRLLKTLGILYVCMVCEGSRTKNGIQIDNNGYTNIVIAIHEDVPQNDTIIDVIKEYFTTASQFLYNATRYRSYFREITILVPMTWDDDASYIRAVSEFYSYSDIRVMARNMSDASQVSTPFVKTYRGCGEPGEYLQLTDHFLTNPDPAYGPVHKLLVHEWAHLRWGVFDEYPMGQDKRFYYSDVTERYEPSTCSHGITGSVHRYVEDGDDVYFVKCRRVNGVYHSSCQFFPDVKQKETVTASFMGWQSIDSIKFFCDDSDNIHHQHNRLAPNRQNRICSNRSTWDVISKTDDFRGANLPRDIDDSELVPTFTLMRRRSMINKVVLVLDKSGSMNIDYRLVRINQAVSQLIRYRLSRKTMLGIVMFSSSAIELVPLTLLDSEATRDTIVKRLDNRAGGGTSIGSGIRKALQMLGGGTVSETGGTIVVLTDGQENNDPRIADIQDEVKLAKVIIHCIVVTENADTIFDLATHTEGTTAKFENLDNSTMIHVALDTISNRLKDIEGDALETDYVTEIFVVALKVDDGSQWQHSALLSDGQGNTTRFSVMYEDENGPPDFTVTDPSGNATYNQDSGSDAVFVDSEQRIVTLTIPGMAESGVWNFVVTNKGKTQRMTMLFTSHPVRFKDAVKITAYRSSVSKGWPPIWVIMADATKGGNPVIGLTITATVERPKGSPIELQLFDNGKDGDVEMSDGIYSRYFKDFNDRGRYGVSLRAESKSTGYTFKTATGSPAQRLIDPENPPENMREIMTTRLEPRTKRVVDVNLMTSGGAIEFYPNDEQLKELQEGKDIYTPGKINDLEVIATDPNSDPASATLSWIATGDDLDEGTASGYEIFISSRSIPEYVVKQDDVIEGNLHAPKPAGEVERFIIKVPYNQSRNMSFLFQVRVHDDEGLFGKRSNEIAAGFGTVPPVVEVNETDEGDLDRFFEFTTTTFPTTEVLQLNTTWFNTTGSDNATFIMDEQDVVFAHTGTVIGVVIGGLVLLGLLLAIIVAWRHHEHRTNYDLAASTPESV